VNTFRNLGLSGMIINEHSSAFLSMKKQKNWKNFKLKSTVTEKKHTHTHKHIKFTIQCSSRENHTLSEAQHAF
jgi:hypothetical protein